MQRTIIAESYLFDKEWIESIPSVFEETGQTVFKKRNEVKIFEREGAKYVVKHYKRPNIAQRIAYSFFRPTKAKRAYEYAERLKAMGVDTPVPIAYIEVRWGCLFIGGYFVSKYSALPDCTLLNERQDTPLEQALAKYMVDLHQKGLLHGDLNLSNILYEDRGDGHYAFSLIDLNRSRFKKKPSYRDVLKNMMRLTHNACLMERMVNYYAEARGWNAAAMQNALIREWRRFRRKKTILYALKGKKW